MKRFRIDFSVKELDAPEGEPRGIVFGEEVSADGIFDFFNRCRDGVITLLTGRRPVEREVAPERYYPGVHVQPPLLPEQIYRPDLMMTPGRVRGGKPEPVTVEDRIHAAWEKEGVIYEPGMR